MNYRDELLKMAEDYQSKIDNLETWIEVLDREGFDWENVTDDQKWAIQNITCVDSNMP